MSFADVHQIADHLREGMGKKDEARKPYFTPYVWRPASDIPRRQFVYGKHYIRQFTSATFAPGGYGKSNLIMTEQMAMASGKALLGVLPRQRLKAAFWNGEDPLVETERRVAAACMHFGLQAHDLEGYFFWGSGRDQDLVIAEQTADGVVLMRPNVERVKEAIRADRLDVLAIDPFVSCHRVPENDNNAVDMVAKEWGRIADETNTSIELSHHTTKAAIGRDVRVEDGRGGGALLFAVRSARVLNTMNDEEAEAAGVVRERRRFYFRVDNGKANLSAPAAGSEWYHFASQDLGNTDGIEPSDNVGVVESWQWPADAGSMGQGTRTARGRLAHRAKIIWMAYWRIIDDGRGVPAPPLAGVPSGQVAVADDELKHQAVRMGLVLEPRPSKDDTAAVKRWQDAARQGWNGGLKELQQKGRVRVEDGFIWHLVISAGVGDED